jgi:hypothetical protein
MSFVRSMVGFSIRAVLPILLVVVGAWLAYEILNTPSRAGKRPRPRVVA